MQRGIQAWGLKRENVRTRGLLETVAPAIYIQSQRAARGPESGMAPARVGAEDAGCSWPESDRARARRSPNGIQRHPWPPGRHPRADRNRMAYTNATAPIQHGGNQSAIRARLRLGNRPL